MIPELRLAAADDAKELLAVYAPYVLHTAFTFETVPPTEEEFRRRIAGTLDEGYPYLVLSSGGTVLGYACARRMGDRGAYRWAAETSVYVRADRRGEGFGRRLYTALEDLLRRQRVVTANACVSHPNPGSERFHEAMGYRLAGHLFRTGFKLGAWRDTLWYQKELVPPPAQPEPFLPVSEIVGTAAELSGGS